jgi:thioredoxin-like negative regulator of GroEL
MLHRGLELAAQEEGGREPVAGLVIVRVGREAGFERGRIVKKDRAWKDDAARKQLIRFFDALGPKHPATLKGRRMLSSVLFS